MLKLAKVLTGVSMVLLLFLVVALNGVSLEVELTEFKAEPATEQPDLARVLIETAKRDDMGSDMYTRPTSSKLEDYQVISIKVSVRNKGILPAEWLQLRLVPETLDVALFPVDALDLPPFASTRTIEATLLAGSMAPQEPRQMRLSYYSFGRQMEAAIR